MSVVDQLLLCDKFDADTKELVQQITTTLDMHIFALEHQHKQGLGAMATAFSTPVWEKVEKVALMNQQPQSMFGPMDSNFPIGSFGKLSIWDIRQHPLPKFESFAKFGTLTSPPNYAQARVEFVTSCFQKQKFKSRIHMQIATQLCKLLDCAQQQKKCLVRDCLCK